jgi:hypothetical protein
MTTNAFSRLLIHGRERSVDLVFGAGGEEKQLHPERGQLQH